MKRITTIGIVLVMFFSLLLLDFVWLGIITKHFLIAQFGSLITVVDGGIQINLLVGLLTWFIIASGCYLFAVHPSSSFKQAALQGATLGFFAYAIYDLTNLAFINNYPFLFVFVDIAWGIVLCSAISTIGYFVRGKLS